MSRQSVAITKEKLFAVAIFIVSFILSVLFLIFRDYFQGATSLGLLGLFVINFVSNASLFISAPTLITVFAGGAIYPPVLVAIFASLGSALGDMLGYVIGHSGRRIILHKLEKKVFFRALEKYFKIHGNWILFLFAFVPNPIFDSIGLIAGAFAFSPVRFFIITFVGRLLRYFLLAQAGSLF